MSDSGLLMEWGLESQQAKFDALVQRWHRERPILSSSAADIIACPAYLRIVAMGWSAVPFIIERLREEGNEPDHWGAALEAITGEDPVPKDSRGDTVGIARAWLAWDDARMRKQSYSSFVSIRVAAESLVHSLDDTTALHGQRDVRLLGGGQHEEVATSGRMAFLSERHLKRSLTPSNEPVHIPHARTDHWNRAIKKSPYSLSLDPLRMQRGSYKLELGQAS